MFKHIVSRKPMLLAAGVCLLCTSQILGAVTETFKLSLSDGVAGNVFGASVAIEGNRVVVGAFNFSGGSAYIFDTVTGLQVNKLVPDDLPSFDGFGGSVSLSGNTVLVGARYKNISSLEDGAAYLFDLSTGNQTARIDYPAPLPGGATGFLLHFGESVAISGDTVLIGAPHDEPDSSMAYLYDLNTGAPPVNILNVVPTGPVAIGAVVALNGNTAIVGTPNADVGGTGSLIGRGAAFIFDATTGAKTVDLLASDASNLDTDKFGFSVSISGNLALVGAPRDSIGGNITGSAYLFDITTGDQLFKLTAGDGADGDWFASSVAISDDYAIVGATRTSGGGAVYLFDLLTGQQVAKFSGSDTMAGDFFGGSVAVDGNTLIVAAPGADGATNAPGAAYLFTIPEPSTLALLLIAGPALLHPRRHARRSAIAR